AIDCEFVFPHPNHPATPNADMFAALHIDNVPGLITTGFPSPNILNGIIVPGNGFSSSVRVDFNPIQANKNDCVFYRIYKRTKSGSTYTDEISETKNFKMPDSFNIGIAGDSYGAGEGAPNDQYQL